MPGNDQRTNRAAPMALYVVPYERGFLVYRPLKRLAFVANAAMLALIGRLRSGAPAGGGAASSRAAAFLDDIGFFDPDPHIDGDGARARTVAVLCLTTACNLRCTYCYAAAGDAPARTLSVDAGRAAIDEVCASAVAAGEPSFTLAFHGGGEPTLARGPMRRLVAYARRRALPCHVTVATNGCWPDADRPWLLDNLDSVSLSCDGMPEVQNAQRPKANGGASFDAVMTTIRALDARQTAYGIRLTVTDATADALPRSIEFLCAESGCPSFQVEPAFGQGRAVRDGTALVDGERFVERLLDAYDIAAAAGRHLYYSGARPWVSTTRFCRALDRALIVTPDGAVTGCYEVCDRRHPLAPAFVIGEGATVDPALRRRLDERIARRRARCQDCFCYWQCAGDCPAKALDAGGADDNFGARCDVNRAITRGLLLRQIAAGGGVWRGDVPMEILPEVCE